MFPDFVFMVRVFIRDYLMVVFIAITIRADSDKKKLPSDEIFYLLSQRRGSVNLCNYLFVRIFIYNEFVFHRIKSLLFFHLSEEAENSYRSYKYTVQNNGHNVSYGKLKVSAE